MGGFGQCGDRGATTAHGVTGLDRTATRLAGAVLVVGTAIMLVGAAIPLLTGLGLEA